MYTLAGHKDRATACQADAQANQAAITVPHNLRRMPVIAQNDSHISALIRSRAMSKYA
jgi:hypothetical protein